MIGGFRSRTQAVAEITTKSALALLDRTADDFLHVPWASLDDLIGGMPAGNIWFIGGFSGDGKTTFLTSAVDQWYESGKRIYYMGLESRPNILKTHWACKRLGFDAGEVLSGSALKWLDWPKRKSELTAMIRSFDDGQTAAQVHFSPVQFVDGKALREAYANAQEFGADLLVIDHIDNIDGDGGSAFQVSRESCATIQREAQSRGVRSLVATQFNNDAVKGNRVGRYLAPQPNYIYMGGHKRQIADGMIGLYRPLQKDLEPSTLRDFQRGLLEPQDVCEPNTMAVSLMKHRLFGSREGRRVYLGLERGRVKDLPHYDQPNGHGIRTSRTL